VFILCAPDASFANPFETETTVSFAASPAIVE
jgi:hypothetical protein